MRHELPERTQLAERNQSVARAFHALTPRQRLRRRLLQAAAHLPLPQQPARARPRVLVIRPDHLGDVLLMTPALHHLRRALPAAEVHALINTASAEILRNNSDVDQVLTLAFPGFARAAQSGAAAGGTLAPYRLAFETARRLRRIGYTHVLVLRPDHWWGALVAFLAGIPVRIGCDHPDVAGFLTHALPYAHEHAVLQNARLTMPLAGAFDAAQLPLRLTATETDRETMTELLQANGVVTDARLIAIQPGAGARIKRWETRKWAAVADRLADEMQAQIVFTGTDEEIDLIHEIGEAMTTAYTHVAGMTTIGMLTALYERAALALGVDSGPMHMASAVGTPTVTLYGPADPVEFGTWGSAKHHPILFSPIACRPCRILDWGTDDLAFHPCVRDIQVAQVLEAARQAMSG